MVALVDLAIETFSFRLVLEPSKPHVEIRVLWRREARGDYHAPGHLGCEFFLLVDHWRAEKATAAIPT